MEQKITKIIDSKIKYGIFGFCNVANIPSPNSTRLKKDGLNTAIMFAFPYNVKKEKPKNISRYAAVMDYHEVIIPKLKALSEILEQNFKGYTFKAFADYSPILEVPAAAKAGLGVIGKNGLLITKEFGSYVFLGEILCDLPLSFTDKTKFCNNCGACKTACPVLLCKEKCVSCITQKKGELNSKEIDAIKTVGSCFGCDICQEVCPYNKDKELTKIEEFLQSYKDEFTPFDDPHLRAYNWRGKGVPKRNYELLKKF